MQIAVTGGAGFIGSHVVDHLVGAGHEVMVLDIATAPHQPGVEFRAVDVTSRGRLEEAMARCDAVYHLAAVADVNKAFADPVRCVEVNILGTVNVLEAARRAGVGRVIFASTVWVYAGCNGQHVEEDSPFFMPGAGHIYTSTKISSEFAVHDYHQLFGLDFTILRYGIPYGPRMRETLVIPVFLREALAGRPIRITGDGSQFRNFVYIEDLARANVMALNEQSKNQTFNLEGARRVTVREVGETIQRLLGGGVEIIYTPARPGDYVGKEVSSARAKAVLGWEPLVDFEEGMRRTVEWYLANRAPAQLRGAVGPPAPSATPAADRAALRPA